MGIGVWYFVRSRPGELQSLPRAHVDRFFGGGGQLPHDDGVACYIEVIVRLQDRQAVEVLRVTASQHGVLDDGTLDRQHLDEVMRLAGEATPGFVLSSVPKQPRRVVDAGHRFAQRRLDHVGKWQLSDAERAALRTLVNRKASRTIL
jgi:hypothetical protein